MDEKRAEENWKTAGRWNEGLTVDLGFPMKQGVLLNHRVRLLLADGHSCYRARRDGERKRKVCLSLANAGQCRE
jgi:hypothetical protein